MDKFILILDNNNFIAAYKIAYLKAVFINIL